MSDYILSQPETVLWEIALHSPGRITHYSETVPNNDSAKFMNPSDGILCNGSQPILDLLPPPRRLNDQASEVWGRDVW